MTKRAPDPPSRFRGHFFSDAEKRARFGEASGPFRHSLLAVACPVDEEDVSSLLRWASAEGIPLIPRGAGTGMPGGNVGSGVALDLTAFRRLDDPDPETRTVSVGAGRTGHDLQERVASAGLFFPALPSSADRCTVGGMVANNASGVRSFRHGSVRAWVDSIRAVLADGSVVTLRRNEAQPPEFQCLRQDLSSMLGTAEPEWPPVAKNSSGYALDRFLGSGNGVDLLVGSEGTLGVVTAARLRLAPQPEGRALMLLPLPLREGLPQAVEFARLVNAVACEFFDRRFLDIAGLRTAASTRELVGGASALLLLEFEGSDDEVEEGLRDAATFARNLGVPFRLGRSEEERKHLWAVRHSASPIVAAQAAQGLVSMQFIEDSVVRADRLPDYLAGLDVILEEERTDAVVFGHAGEGNVHVNPLVDVTREDWRQTVRTILERTVDVVAGLNGTLSGEHGDGRLRGTFHPRIFGEPIARAFRHVKESLDPRGILNPGVVVPLPGQDPLQGLTPLRRVR